jgi:MFS family permease
VSSSPSPAKRPRIFYGWYIIGLTGLAGIFAGGTSQAFFGIFVPSIEEDTGWSRTSIAGVITLATFIGGGLSIAIGALADRYGPRVLMTLGAATYAAGYMSMLWVVEIWHLYIAYSVARLAALQALSGVVPRSATINWFRRMRGRALGLQTMAQPLGGALLGAISGTLLTLGVEWRTVLFVIGLTALTLLLVPLPLIIRRQPEDMGMLPDGNVQPPSEDVPSKQAPGSRSREPEVSWTLREAMRTKALWMVAFGTLLNTMASGGISFNLAAYFSDTGLGTGFAAAAASIFLFSGALSASVWGFLSERYDERMLVVWAALGAAALTLFALAINNPVSGLIFAAGYGATTRGESALVMLLLATYFGRQSFGAISGLVTSISFLGLGAGPLAFSLLFEATGSYNSFFLTAFTILLMSAVMLWAAKRPSRVTTSV